MQLKSIYMAIVMVLFFSNCASVMVRNQIQKTKTGGRFFLHENPKIGDYAIYDSFSETELNVNVAGSSFSNRMVQSLTPRKITLRGIMKYEIIDITDSTIIIRQSDENIYSSYAPLPKRVVDFEVDKTGLQLRATIVENQFVTKPITVVSAKPGERGFTDTTFDKDERKIKINTPAGVYLTKPAYAIQNIDLNANTGAAIAMGSVGTQSIIFVNPKVNFQMVYNQGVVAASVSSKPTTQLKVFLNVLKSSSDFFTNPAEGTKFILKLGLKDYINKKITIGAQQKLNELAGDIDNISTSVGIKGASYYILREQGNHRMR